MRDTRSGSVMATPALAVFLLVSAMAASASAQFFAACEDGSLDELEHSILAHNEHVHRLTNKFEDVWYLQGPVPAEVRTNIRLSDIPSFLARMPARRAAVLFHAVRGDRLCAWLVTGQGGGSPVSVVQTLDERGWSELQQWQSRATRGRPNLRVAEPVPWTGAFNYGATSAATDEGLRRIGRLLLPPPIAARLLKEQIDTLVVVPVTITLTEPGFGSDPARLVLAVSTIPFPALPLAGKQVIDYMSVLVAPGFFIFGQDPASRTPAVSTAVVAGDPRSSGFAALPGARREAQAVARLTGTAALLGPDATRAAVERRVKDRARSVGFIHLATHGLASGENPLDGSFLVFSDGHWTARAISQLRQSPRPGHPQEEQTSEPLLQAGPLVVMSACQTGRGKDFDVGTTGLARAWLWAGATNVVMSLWNVDDEATVELMEQFVKRLLNGLPPDQSLREAAILLRQKHSDPFYWASFGVFGRPLDKCMAK